MNNNEDPIKRDLKKANLIILGEVFFALLPFIIIFFVSIQLNNLIDLWRGSELSLASVIMSGQALIRLVSGLIRFEGTKQWEKASCLVIMVFCLPVINLIIFSALRFSPYPSPFYQVIQVLMFIITLVAYVIFGGAGQYLIDNKALRKR